MNAFRSELHTLVARHVAAAPTERMLRLVETLAANESMLELPATAGAARFTKLDANGKPMVGEHVAVYDSVTDLTWLAGPVEGSDRNWEDSLKAAAAVRLFGHTDWRAPTIQEQLSIIDYGRCDPAVDTDLFKGPYGWAWTSTKAASPSGDAWGVYLDVGFAYRDRRGSRYRVRAVRVGQSLALGI